MNKTYGGLVSQPRNSRGTTVIGTGVTHTFSGEVVETITIPEEYIVHDVIAPEGDVQVFKDPSCTVYADGTEKVVYVRLNTAVGFGEGFTVGDGSVQGDCFNVTAPSEGHEDNPYFVQVWNMWGSDDFAESFTEGQIVECTNTDSAFEPVENPTTIFSKPEPDYKNIVGSYVYSDGTLGSTVKEGIVGVVAIPANACPDDKARIVPINGAASNIKWANDDYGDMSALEDLGVSADGSFPYINDGFNITDTVLGISNDDYYLMFWIEPTSLILSEWNDNELVTVSLSLQTESLYIGYYTADYEEADFKVLPLPYLADGTPNPYIKTMNGWNEGIANATKLAGKSPLFDFASAFSKQGFPAGNWFIPSFPELIMLFGKYATIYNAISAANGDVSWLITAANTYRGLWCSQCDGISPWDEDGKTALAWTGSNNTGEASFNCRMVDDPNIDTFGVPMAKLN